MRRPEIVDKVAAMLHAIVPEAECILYGSEARGDARSDSDIDVLVKLPFDGPCREFQMRRIYIVDRLYDIELETGVIISAHVVPKWQWEQRRTFFSMNIAREGIPL